MMNTKQESKTGEGNAPREYRSPRIGETVVIGWGNTPCKVVQIHPFGTIDVVSLDNKHAYRVSGLPFILNTTARTDED